MEDVECRKKLAKQILEVRDEVEGGEKVKLWEEVGVGGGGDG